jgi:hypothetical protein
MKTPQQRFDEKWIPEPNSGCWLWLGAAQPLGYGYFWHKGDGAAHVFAWEQENGPVPPGLVLRHKCDNGHCVNPGHLELGTRQDNQQDMVRRGRASQAKITLEQVEAIRADPRLQREIAADLGITQAQVSNIKSRKQWRTELWPPKSK